MNEQETHAEVIAEMRGAKTEYPFVYLIGELDTPEVLNCRNEIIEPRKINIRLVTVKELANRLEAAHDRETRGNAAMLRETACAIRAGILKRRSGNWWFITDSDILEKIDAALAEPPRNCDMPLVVDGPADNNADKAWLAFKRHNPDAYFDVSGLLRCIDWLLAPATNKEGGAK